MCLKCEPIQQPWWCLFPYGVPFEAFTSLTNCLAENPAQVRSYGKVKGWRHDWNTSIQPRWQLKQDSGNMTCVSPLACNWTCVTTDRSRTESFFHTSFNTMLGPGSMPLDHASVLGRESDGNGPCHVQNCLGRVVLGRFKCSATKSHKGTRSFFVHRNELHWWQWFSLKLLSWIKMMKFKDAWPLVTEDE